ncbi:MAG: DJ-1/PfpI family protein [Candidatus Marsarchaeota archaeon]|nr:DJ-1/PfpI family protein [Candidatus Marsarchaeota archaeon]
MRMLIFLPPVDFREESLKMLKLFFDRWGVDYKTTSYTKSECRGKHGAYVKPDVHTADIDVHDYDGIVFLDGEGIDTMKLYEFRPLLDLAMIFDRSTKQIWAVGNAVKIIARSNIIKGKEVSIPKNEETLRLVRLFHGEPSASPYKLSGNIVTISTGSALESSMDSILSELNIK